jgi:hypothetical protein
MSFIPYNNCSGPPVATITPAGHDTICAGDSVTLTASIGVGYTYLWSDSAHSSSRSITVSTAGSYTVTVYNFPDSTVSAPTVIAVNSRPTVTWNPTDTTLCNNIAPFNILSGAVPSGGIYSGLDVSSDTFYNHGLNGYYWVKYTYTDNHHCINSDSVYFSSTICEGISNVNLSNPVSVSPNPNNGLFTLHAPGRNGSYYEITDELGRTIVQDSISSEYSQVDMSVQQGGIYYLTVKNALQNETIRFVVVK